MSLWLGTGEWEKGSGCLPDSERKQAGKHSQTQVCFCIIYSGGIFPLQKAIKRASLLSYCSSPMDLGDWGWDSSSPGLCCVSAYN